MNHQQAIAASKQYFEWFKDATELHITSDGLGHDNKQYAKDHSQRLDDQTIYLVTKEQLEESEKEAEPKAKAAKK